MFGRTTKLRLALGTVFRTNPLYVQFYVTARCNLTCEQCNIIYANSDVRECTLDEIEQIAENLAVIGVAIVLLTGGEPFLRSDLPEVVGAFTRHGIHVRIQTNGYASAEALQRCVEHGARDISISLDTLQPDLQDAINGGFVNSWRRAIATIAKVTHYLPPERSFAAFGCVLSPSNIDQIEDIVRFGTEIGWYTSLVPVHVTNQFRPMNFRSYDQRLAFGPEHYGAIDALITRLQRMKQEGFLLYDSDAYFDDIRRFVRGEPIQWRRKNGHVCDSPGLYFAILPNGDFAVCCDHRLPSPRLSTVARNFPAAYRDGAFKARVVEVAERCPGCMFGSYPEVTITARYWSAAFERLRIFMGTPPSRPWPLTEQNLIALASRLRAQHHAVA